MSLEEEYGNEKDPSVVRAELDNKILDILRDNSDIREGKIILDQIHQLTDADDLEEFKELTGLSDETIRRGVMNNILNAYARYSRDKEDSPEAAKAARETLVFELSQAKTMYSADIMKIVFDRKADSKSSLKENILTGDLAKTLAIMNAHPELVNRGRDGSVSLEPHYDDTVKTAMSQARGILGTVPGMSVNTLPEGTTVIGKDEEGNRYRLSGDGDYIQLQREIDGDWKPVARRKTLETADKTWVKVNPANGKDVMRPGRGASERTQEPEVFPGVGAAGANGNQAIPPSEHQRETEEMMRRVQPPPGSNPPRGRQREEENRGHSPKVNTIQRRRQGR
jgi:hypothetical protein